MGTHRHYVPTGTFRHNVPTGTFVLNVPVGTLVRFLGAGIRKQDGIATALPLQPTLMAVGLRMALRYRARLDCLSHLLTVLVPEGLPRVGEIGTVGWGSVGSKSGWRGRNACFQAERRRSVGLGVRRGLRGWLLLGGLLRGTRLLGELLRRMLPGGGFGRGRFVY